MVNACQGADSLARFTRKKVYSVKKKTTVSPAASVSVTFLGGFSLKGKTVSITDDMNRSQKVWSVLSYLILNRERNISQAEFIDTFWSSDRSSNPVNALKTLLYRIRTLLDPVFGPNLDPVISQRGSYAWNPAILCKTDVDEFEALCHRAGDAALEPAQRIALYAKAVALFRGDFLPDLADQLWVINLSAHYHRLFLDAVKEYAALLEASCDYVTLYEICSRAIEVDPLDESLHIPLIRALVRQGKDVAALAQYEATTDLLYRKLGARPSQELQELYREIMAIEKDLETDLSVIQSDLRETAGRTGPFLCEYGLFREIYRLEARRAARNGTCVHLCLLTVTAPDGSEPSLSILGTTMDQLLSVLSQSLRSGDVVSKYSSGQYVVLLPAANFEDSTMVMERLVHTFYRQHRRHFLRITYKIRELELT